MNLPLTAETPPIRVDEGGAVRIGHTRVLLVLVIHAYQQGDTPEEILERYPALNLGDVYTVIGYYLRNRSRVDEYLAEYECAASAVRREIEELQGNISSPRQRILEEKSKQVS